MATKLRRSNFHTDADNHVNESINAKLAANLGNISTGNITTTGYIAGPATFTIDPAAVGDNTGTLIVAGNLQVDGTTTTINSTTLEVDDLNITLASGAANATAANGAGITVDGASATITYASASDAWSFNKNVGIGTSSPATALEVSTTSPIIRSTHSFSGDYLQLFHNGSGAYIDFSADPLIIRGASNTERMRIDTSGNVGIGDNILSNGNSHNRFVRISNTGSGARSALEIEGNTPDAHSGIWFKNNGTNANVITSRGAGDLTFLYGASSTEAMRIDSSGKVGIQETSPDAYLHVKGKTSYTTANTSEVSGLQFVRFQPNSNNEDSLWFHNSGNVLGISAYADAATTSPEHLTLQTYGGNVGIGTSSPSGVLAVTDGSNGLIIGQSNENFHAANSHRFYSQNYSTEHMHINSSGNVGIGTSSVTSGFKLEVAGGDVRFGDAYNDDAVEIGWSAGASQGFIQAYDRAASAFRNLNLNNAVTIDSNGNVGIGVTSMTNKLVLPNAAYFAMQDTGGAESLAIRANTSNAMEFLTGGGERMHITSSGNVGIGTTTPVANLEIKKTVSTTGSMTDTALHLTTDATTGRKLNIGFGLGGGVANTNAAVIGFDVTSGTGATQGDLFFSTRNGTSDSVPTERMRITSGGNLTIGNSVANTASGYSNQPGGGYVASDSHFEFATTANRSAVEIGKNNANDGDLVTFRKQGTTVGSVSVTSSGTTYNTTSDIRLKIDIEPIADATDKVMAMNAVTHKWKNDPDADSIHGFIAQEMRDIVPEAVSQGQEENDTWSMDYGRITPVIVAALQDALKEIDMLKNRITELEAK